MKRHGKIYFTTLLSAGVVGLSSCCSSPESGSGNGSLVIKEQGSFSVGGNIKKHPGVYESDNFDNFNPYEDGQTVHGDHAYVFYQVPENARQLPLVFLHGAGQSSRTWETTPDGREGFQNIFLRRGFSVYLVDQPRRGKAGRSTEGMNIASVADDQMWFEIFRMGDWPDFHEGTQFPTDSASLDQFFRQMTPNTGPFDSEVVARSMIALFDKTGPGILITHSQGGLPGWQAALGSDNIKAIVSYEPGTYLFPQGELPEPITGRTGTLNGVAVPTEDFLKLTRIPIVLYFGDYIKDEETGDLGSENWRTRLELGRRFVETINRHGGDAQLVELPEIGIYGNTHFMFAEKNNIQIADLLSDWLKGKGLDK